ncbi:ATPase, AAA-type, core, P-loop containing nucleoside triphosphate hydrolase [Tanacetum coccineum]
MEKCNKDGSMVVVVAATHSLETLDPALMSSYWFQKTFHVAKPEEDSKRKKVGLYFKDYILEEDKEAICNLIASHTPGSVWANLKNIVAESVCSARWRGGDHVTMDDVRRAVRRFNTHGCYDADEPVTQEPMRLIVGSQN